MPPVDLEKPVFARVTRHFNVTPERVFDAWLAPQMVGRWMFGPAVRNEEVVRMTANAWVGGSFSFVVRRNGEEIDHIGYYVEIVRPRRLVFTWAVAPDRPDASHVYIDIASQGKECDLTLSHELHPNWADYVGPTEASWNLVLDSLAAALGERGTVALRPHP